MDKKNLVSWALLRQVQGHLNCFVRSPPSPAIDQNVKKYYPHIGKCHQGTVHCLHLISLETIYSAQVAL